MILMFQELVRIKSEQINLVNSLKNIWFYLSTSDNFSFTAILRIDMVLNKVHFAMIQDIESKVHLDI